ncbi:hypothetical protein Val02_82150 [Virgisporangium aliadipatigenens]|uniref:Uncharacterized protein n=1 Tax=Virgisporangium aliadipatigenens TaxID=741659 RepID=A0A8J3YTC9_9ACTN|nr:hypothetical protein [Virgisporangium aliadipatigenens]GIJ51329.1 hypothetical protein Val02_82150 [Virgisporangium aliadipatigenens]
MAWTLRPAIPAGHKVTADEFDAILDQIEYLSQARECSLIADHAGVANNITPGGVGTITNLSRLCLPNSKHHASGLIAYSAHINGDFRPSAALPSGSTVQRASLRSMTSTNDSSSGDTYYGSATTLGTLTAPGQTTSSDIVWCEYDIIFTTGATAGSATLTYAQGSSNATATYVRAHSTWRVEAIDAV